MTVLQQQHLYFIARTNLVEIISCTALSHDVTETSVFIVNFSNILYKITKTKSYGMT